MPLSNSLAASIIGVCDGVIQVFDVLAIEVVRFVVPLGTDLEVHATSQTRAGAHAPSDLVLNFLGDSIYLFQAGDAPTEFVDPIAVQRDHPPLNSGSTNLLSRCPLER